MKLGGEMKYMTDMHGLYHAECISHKFPWVQLSIGEPPPVEFRMKAYVAFLCEFAKQGHPYRFCGKHGSFKTMAPSFPRFDDSEWWKRPFACSVVNNGVKTSMHYAFTFGHISFVVE